MAGEGRTHHPVLTLHHIVADGWSVPVMLADLLASYAPHGPVPQLPALAPYAGYFS